MHRLHPHLSLLVGGIALLVSALLCQAAKPNVLYILTDDQRWDALGLAGSKHLKTPHIDRLGQEGVYFKNAFCTTSLCSPSRASILSGLYAHTHGVTNNFTEYPENFRSFPMVLQDQGYDTAYIGKWHMGEDNGILNGEHGMVDKRTAHEPSIRIVQVARYPGLTPPGQPKVIEEQVLLHRHNSMPKLPNLM